MEYQKLLDNSEDWLKYAIQVNLLQKPKKEILEFRSAALADSRIQRALEAIADFHGTRVTNHKNPTLPSQQLMFLLDIGFDTEIPQIKTAIDEILKHRDSHGVYQSMTNVPVHFGGTGADMFSWCLCDAPLLLLALFKADIDYEEYIQPGVDYLVALSRDNGFPCAVSPEQGKFRGPGKKEDCCPYATLQMADLLSYIPEYRDSHAAVSSVLSLLSLWENSLTMHPYLFYMGTDFRKLKAPSYWYDIVSVTNVLSKYQFARNDPRFLEMIALIRSKQSDDGFFIPEAVSQKMKEWDFGQKKARSPYLTYLCMRIEKRLEQG